MPLDSDISNADAQLHVEFYTHDKAPYKGVPFIRIMVPGDKTQVYDQPARDDHKQRFQRHWLHYQMQNAGDVIGIPLMTWHQERPDDLTDGQMHELFILKFQSVEQVALASDMQISRIGMGAAGIRERARLYLAGKNAKVAGAELQQAKSEIAELRAMIEKMATAQPVETAKPKRRTGGGWNKGKKKVRVNEHNDNAAIGAAGSQ